MSWEKTAGKLPRREFIMAVSNLLCAEEHAFENGNSELAQHIREKRKLVVSLYADAHGKNPTKDPEFKTLWCIFKHLLLANYHILELSLQDQDGIHKWTREIYAKIWKTILQIHDIMFHGEKNVENKENVPARG